METFIGLTSVAIFAALYVYFYKRHNDSNSKMLAGLMCSGLIIGTAFLIVFNVMAIVNDEVAFANVTGRFLFIIMLASYVTWLIFFKGGRTE